MASKRTRGACTYCGRAMTRGGMARHLRACDARQEAIASAQADKVQPVIHLQVQPAYGSDYWLHLEQRGTSTLQELDSYLRAIWLECCGHLSQFSADGWGSGKIGMARKAADVLTPGTELTHTYDFGTESVTTVKVVDVREGRPTTRHPIALMARNEAPVYDCQACGSRATHLCMECAYEYEQPGLLCAKHAEEHPHESYGEPMPLYNSPRTGMCGYDGPAAPPY